MESRQAMPKELFPKPTASQTATSYMEMSLHVRICYILKTKSDRVLKLPDIQKVLFFFSSFLPPFSESTHWGLTPVGYFVMHMMSLTFLSLILFPFVVGLLITSPLKYIVEEPPPSRLYADETPRSFINSAS